MSALGRRADIQGLRAIAVFAVVAYHAGFGFSGGYVGVDMFFVISGFVITRMLLTELTSTGSIDFRRFYLRRARRLLPALALTLAIALPLSVLLAPMSAQSSAARTGVSAALFNANHYLAFFGADGGYFELGSHANPMLHMWSLSVEEQFYMVFPLLLFVGWRLGRKGRAERGMRASAGPAVLMAAIVAVSFALSLALRYGTVDPGGFGAELAFYSAPSRAWEFALGGLVAVVQPRVPAVVKRFGSPLVCVGTGAAVVACVVFDDTTVFPGVAVALPVVGTALAISGGDGHRTDPVSRLLGTRALGVVGDLSYGWYLWHWPMIVFAAALMPEYGWARPVAALMALGVAWLSYRWVENPIRHRAHVTQRATIGLAFACVMLPLAGGVTLELGGRHINSLSIASDFGRHIDYLSGCDGFLPLSERDPDRCVWGATSETAAPDEVVLIGDSNAGQFSEGMISAAEASGVRLRIATSAGCPFVRLDIWTEGTRRPECRHFVDESVAELARLKPRVVVIASASDVYIRSSRFQFAEPGSSQRLISAADKAAAWAPALTDVLDQLRDAGIPVVVVHPVPRYPSWKPIAMAPMRLLGPLRFVIKETPRAVAVELREQAVAVELQAAQATGASTLDFFDELCPSDPCSTRGDSIWLNLDDGHISTAASERLAPLFVAELSTLLKA